MKDPRYIVTTIRIPAEVHARMKRYIKYYNKAYKRWDEPKMSMTFLVGNSVKMFMDLNRIGEDPEPDLIEKIR